MSEVLWFILNILVSLDFFKYFFLSSSFFLLRKPHSSPNILAPAVNHFQRHVLPLSLWIVFPLFYSISPHNSFLTSLLILGQGKIYPSTIRKAIWTALGWAYCPLEHWMNPFLSCIGGSRFLDTAPNPIDNCLILAADLIQPPRKNIALILSLFPFASKQYSTDEILFPRCIRGF